MVTVNFPPFKTLVNKPFASLLNDRSRIKLLWGGRGSGKSVAAIRLLLVRSITLPYFKCICIRKVFDTCKESQFEAIKAEAKILGIDSLFVFQISPLSIRCKYSNSIFLFRGLDKPDKLKSIKDPSHAWYEEGSQIEEKDWITVSSSLRTGVHKVRIEEVFSFNPETNGEIFTDFWLYKRFFADKIDKTFVGSIDVENPHTGEINSLTYRSIWTDYSCNPFISNDFIAFLETLRIADPYYYTIYALGDWGNKQVGNKFYKTFDVGLNVCKAEYIETLPLHVTFDENVNPFLTLNVWQARVRGDKIDMWQIDEIHMQHPFNTLKHACEEFANRYSQHSEGLYIYGDRTSIKQDVKLEKGQNFYTIAYEHLKDFRPTLRIPSINPNVKSRADFINDLMLNDKGVTIKIGANCKNTIADYQNVTEAQDGTKVKKKFRDKDSGATFEKWGHSSDANDYLIVELLKERYLAYISGGKEFTYTAQSRENTQARRRITL
jgi:phage terminase large subunit